MSDSVNIGIRLARPADASAVASIYIDSWRETYAGILPTNALAGMSTAMQERQWIQTIKHANLRSPVLVASDGDSKLYGFASAGPNRERSFPQDAEIYTLYVAPGFTGQGIGSAIMASAFRLLSKAPYQSMIIWALADNPSRFFYEALGGKRVAERHHPLWGQSYREVAYAWDRLDLTRRSRLIQDA